MRSAGGARRAAPAAALLCALLVAACSTDPPRAHLPRMAVQDEACRENLAAIGAAFKVLLEREGGRFPYDADRRNWPRLIEDLLPRDPARRERLLHCPKLWDPDGDGAPDPGEESIFSRPSTYVLNYTLLDKDVLDLGDPSLVPLLFEDDILHHAERHILLLDGTVTTANELERRSTGRPIEGLY